MPRLFIRLCLMGLALTACQSSQTFVLEATATQQKEKIMISGKANLPDKTQILISLLKPAEKNPLKSVVIREFGNVANGKFDAVLAPTGLLKIPPAKYTVRLEFSPLGYDWSGGQLKQLVGARGEKLTGKYVRQTSDGVKILENTFNFEYKASH